MMEDKLKKIKAVAFDVDGADPLEATLVWDVPGMMLLFR